MATPFEETFTVDLLLGVAGEPSYERGADYAADSRVKRLHVGAEEATAVVRGAHTFRVRLWVSDGEPGFSCTCPVGAEGRFCKHCVPCVGVR
jgi:uncharacterized Zn finger protein